MDPSNTIATIFDDIGDDDITIKNEKILKPDHINASNIPGTLSYWKITHNEFKAINFYNSYVKKQEVSIFRTGSLAEYHKYYL